MEPLTQGLKGHKSTWKFVNKLYAAGYKIKTNVTCQNKKTKQIWLILIVSINKSNVVKKIILVRRPIY